MFLELFIT